MPVLAQPATSSDSTRRLKFRQKDRKDRKDYLEEGNVRVQVVQEPGPEGLTREQSDSCACAHASTYTPERVGEQTRLQRGR
jgi:hypothetical protein